MKTKFLSIATALLLVVSAMSVNAQNSGVPMNGSNNDFSLGDPNKIPPAGSSGSSSNSGSQNGGSNNGNSNGSNSINTINKPALLTVFPNPTQGDLNVKIEAEFISSPNGVFRIVNQQGNVMYTENFIGGDHSTFVDVKSFPEGNYLAQVSWGDKFISRRFRKFN